MQSANRIPARAEKGRTGEPSPPRPACFARRILFYAFTGSFFTGYERCTLVVVGGDFWSPSANNEVLEQRCTFLWLFSFSVCTKPSSCQKSQTKEPLKISSLSGIRSGKVISVLQLLAQQLASSGNKRILKLESSRCFWSQRVVPSLHRLRAVGDLGSVTKFVVRWQPEWRRWSQNSHITYLAIRLEGSREQSRFVSH